MANDTALANSSASVNSGPPAPPSPAAALFQKAHAKMVTLQRLDEQLCSMLEQRKKLQDELRCCQLQINEEFERIMHAAREGESRFMAQYADVAAGNGQSQLRQKRNGKEPLQLEVAEAI
jgi:hypothetical protein